MIRIECPKCEEDLRFPDDKAGRDVNCEVCGTLISLPGERTGKATDGGNSRSLTGVKKSKQITAECPGCEETYPARSDEVGSYIRCPNCARRIMIREQVEKTEEEPVSKPRRRRRRSRRASSRINLAETFRYWFSYPIILGVLVAIGLLGIGVALLWPPGILITLVLGILMVLVGFFWMIVAAWVHDAYGGFIVCVSLLLGPGIIGALLFAHAYRDGHIHLGELVQPFLVLVVGLAFGGIAIGLMAAMHWFTGGAPV